MLRIESALDDAEKAYNEQMKRLTKNFTESMLSVSATNRAVIKHLEIQARLLTFVRVVLLLQTVAIIVLAIAVAKG